MLVVARLRADRRPWWLLAVVVGMSVRVAWLLATVHPPRFEPVFADPAAYLFMADHAYEGQWLTGFFAEPTSYLSVGYPALLAVVRFASLGLLSSWGAALLVNLAASVALIVGVGRLAGLVADRLGVVGAPRNAAVAAGAWTIACFPDAITATGLVMTELVAVALLVWALVSLAAVFAGDRSTRLAVTIGALVGLAVFVRPSWAALLVMVPAMVCWRTRVWRPALLVAAAALVVISPALWNNMARVHAGVGLTSATWVNICDGAARADGQFMARPECRLAYEFLPPPGEEAATVKVAEAQARHDIADAPVRWVAAMPVRLYRAFGTGGWGVTVSQEWSQHLGSGRLAAAALWISKLGYGVVMLAGSVGLALAVWRRRVLLWLVMCVCAGTLIGVAVSFGQPRFGWPTQAAVMVPYGAALLAARTSRKSEPAGAASCEAGTG